jgi:glucoamylase
MLMLRNFATDTWQFKADSSTVMGAVYGELPATEPLLLATAAVVWDAFRNLYGINDSDVPAGRGPLIGRYPEDTYDGDVSEPPNVGHPWPLCTALFAQFYYRVAEALQREGAVRVTDQTRRFYEQIGFPPAGGLADAVACLAAAADRMLGAVLYHADYLELSEQFDRDSGYEKSVRNLTWSYGSFLSAVRAKNQL